MTTLQVKKKKKRAIMMEETSITEKDALEIIEHLEITIKKLMKFHIGQEQAISHYDLFVKLFNIAPTELDVYKRTYWWNLVKKIFRKLRNSNELFVVTHSCYTYVLKTEEELMYVINRYDRNITAMKASKLNAIKWVQEQKWRELL